MELVHAHLKRGCIATRLVAARLEAFLHNPAEMVVFLLDFVAGCEALCNELLQLSALEAYLFCIQKVVEKHGACSLAGWHHCVRVHPRAVSVDHEVGMAECVDSTLTEASVAFSASDQLECPIQDEARLVRTHVDTVGQSFMRNWHMIATVEIIVAEDFPVAVHAVCDALDMF